MLDVKDKFFNSVFISYSHAEQDKAFAKQFKEKLQGRLYENGNSILVWMDDDIPEGKGWRRNILKHLDSTALMVVIVSPDSIASSHVLFEWHYSLLVLQDDPFLFYLRKCEEKQLRMFQDYQLSEPFDKDLIAEEKALENICNRLDGYNKLQESYDALTYTSPTPIDVNVDRDNKRAAASVLGSAPDGLSVAAVNYLIAALQFWLSSDNSYGYTLADIAVNLGKLGKRKAASVVMKAYMAQAQPGHTNMPSVLNPIKMALDSLICDDPPLLKSYIDPEPKP